MVFPVVSLTIAGAERVVYPELRTPPGVDVAEALFTFEQILLSRGFRVTRHVYMYARPSYMFEFEVAPGLVGEMVLGYDSQSETLHFEAVRFEEKDQFSSDRTRFEHLTDDLLEGVINEIQGRL